MNVWNAFPFVRYSLALIIGIILSPIYPVLWVSPQVIIPVFIFLVSFTAFSFRKRNLNLFRILSGLFTLILIAYIGGYLAKLHDQRHRTTHYLNLEGSVSAFSGTISSDYYEREKYFRYEIQLDSLILDSAQQEVSGIIYLYVRKDSISVPFSYGTRLYVRGNYYEIEGPKNPDEFDYRGYLANKNIFAQAYVSHTDIMVLGVEPSNRILAMAYRVRNASSQMIADFIPGSQESAVLNALLIGVKDYLDNEIKDAYSAAGAMHVLAVSGLHVGIVYLLITIVFGFLKKSTWGKVGFLIISLSIIWCYALITGFSPSVMRAATMFSVIIIGDTSKRNANIYNSLGLAAFILLLYNPYFIYEVGFQLSFIAVFGIVMFQPVIYRQWEPSNKLLDYIWAIISVSIAAQLVTFPLSVYYFNQFPTYFLLSNLVVIPASMVMLTTGLFMLGVGCISLIAGQTVGFLLGTFVHFVNWLILMIRELPLPAIEWLYLSGFSVLLIYLFMLYFFQGINNFHFYALIFSLICLVLLLSNLHYEKFRSTTQQRMVIYQMEDQPAIDLIDGKESRLIFLGEQENLKSQIEYRINPHRLASRLFPVQLPLDSSNQQMGMIETHGMYFLTWNGYKILIIGAEWDGKLTGSMDTDILLLLSEEIDIIKQINHQFLIVGPIKPWWRRSEVVAHLQDMEIAFHDLEEAGFFELDLNYYAESFQPSIFVK